MLNEIEFQIFFRFKIKSDKDVIGYHLLILDIIKYLARQDYDRQRPWVFGDRSLLDQLLSNIDLSKLSAIIKLLTYLNNKLYSFCSAFRIDSRKAKSFWPGGQIVHFI